MSVEKLNFSVVIPCYNYAQVLTRAVESVVKQEGDDYEVIIVDDGSTDDSADVAKVLAEKYAGLLTYFYKKNGGVSSARNCGIDHSRGDYLLFLDADDEMAEGALAALRDQALLARAPALIVGGHYTQFSSGKTKYHASGTVVKNCELNFLAYIRKLISVANGAIAMHRRVFDDIRYDTEIKQSEDIPVFGQIFARYPCEALDKAIAVTHRHEGSMRNNIKLADQMGLIVVDKLFNDTMPKAFFKYRDEFLCLRTLSLFRRYYKARRPDDAKACYRTALRSFPHFALRWQYLSKYLRLVLLKKSA
jgi:glycosyltransferase involved in cell wall biosynthesis